MSKVREQYMKKYRAMWDKQQIQEVGARRLQRFIGHTNAITFQEPMFIVYSRELVEIEDDFARLLAVARVAKDVLETIADGSNWSMGGDPMYGSPLWDKHPIVWAEKALKALAAVEDLL